MKQLLYMLICGPFERYLMKKGFTKWFAQKYISRMVHEFLHYELPFNQKIWAIRHGFYPSNMDLLSLNNANYKQYLSNYDYYLIYPINNIFKFWIDDKLTTKFLFQNSRFKEYMPKYYIYIENDGHYSYLMDFDEQIPKDSDVLLNILKKEKTLVVKPMAGSCGFGFMKMEYQDNQIVINGKAITYPEFDNLKNHLKGCIVTEYCYQHNALKKVWPKSECTLRLVTARVSGEYSGSQCKTFICHARFGTELSGETSNLSQGGVGIPIDYETGIYGDHFFRYKKFEPSGQTIHDVHPDTHISVTGEKVPHWDMVKLFIKDFTDYVSTLDYFGFDIIITDDGIKVLEINSHPCLDLGQLICGPVLDNPFAKNFFETRISKKS